MILPEKHKNIGLHIFCTKHGCLQVITKKGKRCKLKPHTLAANCPHEDKHRYQSRVFNPYTGQSDITKLHSNVENVDEAVDEHRNFKKEVKAKDYNVIKEEKPKTRPVLLDNCIDAYLDYLEDVGVPEHEKKDRSKKHIDDQKRYLKTFLDVLKKKYDVRKIAITALNKDMIAMLYNELNTRDIKPRTWNAHFMAGKWFFNWLNRPEQGYNLINHFKAVKLRPEAKDPQIMEESEFETMIELMTPENGIELIPRKGRKKPERKQRFKPWLKNWLKVSLFTGGRRQDVSLMKIKHIKNNYIEIPNHKVNNIEKTNINESYVPLTAELQTLLLKMDVYDRDPEEYVFENQRENRNGLAIQATEGFKHFWRLTKIEKELTLHCLRRTYVTRMILLKGEKGAGVHHKNLETAYAHYFSKQEANKDLVGNKVFDLNV